ncbi:major facilitator superfamily domain-containing protein [Polychytrium aggregatum]|uniref:major facilitator superfamily domain-containing protein n=1 Tax=Polychytrium aggregatum TaxID=110093 RepID=UPI0022FEE1DC|nr:major facilitator superfamily domain-containing protein [Polychytrium aggregatum]KAI9203836.1 major facilitator superfamily domain-containing protein [Polychytrium aggregatum]
MSQPRHHRSNPSEQAPLLPAVQEKREPTPLPWMGVIVVSIVLFCNSFVTTVLLPFVTFMVEDFGVAKREEDIGRLSGYIVASYMLGQLFCSYPWGRLSDTWGRRPVLLMGLFGASITCLAFGFSPNYHAALVLRMFCGAINGVVGVTKSYLSEITDETNQSKGFALLGLNRAFGLIVGPAVGGLLCLPAKKYPQYFPPGSFFDRYPYSLPCIVGFVIAMSGFCAAWFVIKETLPPRTALLSIDDRSESDELSDAEANQLLEGPNVQHLPDRPSYDQPDSVMTLMQDRRVFISIALYALISGFYIQWDEALPMYLRLPYAKGGVNFDTTQIGFVFSFGGLTLIVYQLWLYAPIERRLGALLTFRTGILMTIPAFLILPSVSWLYVTAGWSLWTMLFILQGLRTMFGFQAMTSTFIMVANSTTARSRGSINGLAQTFAAMARMVGPIIGGTLFSWSLDSSRVFPFDYHFEFYFIALSAIFTYVVSLYIDDEINHRRLELI